MAFLEQRLSTRIERGAIGGPVNRGRQMVRSAGGKLRQVFTWAEPLREFTINHGIMEPADARELLSLWYVVNFTPYEGFRLRDWADYVATQATSRCTLISGSNYQLQVVYTFAGIEFVRKITKPVAGAKIYRTRSAVVSEATATIDTTTGVAAISGHTAGDTYTWEGQFDVPVTFSGSDWMPQAEAMSSTGVVATMPTIQLEELPL